MKKIFFCCVLAYTRICHADLPLTVENVIADKGKTTLDLGLTYGNTKSNNTKLDGYIPVQISTSSFINIPTSAYSEKSQNEFLIATIGAKHGIFKNLDISLRSNFLYRSDRYIEIDKTEKTSSDLSFADLSFGINYQFLQDAKYPAIVGFSEIQAYEKNDYKNVNFSGLTLGLTTYRSYDPIVLSLTTGYKFNRTRMTANGELKPADLFFLNPQVAFAANDKISLIAGFGFKATGNQRLNDKDSETALNSLDYSFGLGYGLDSNSSFNLIATIRQEFANSSEIRLNYNTKF